MSPGDSGRHRGQSDDRGLVTADRRLSDAGPGHRRPPCSRLQQPHACVPGLIMGSFRGQLPGRRSAQFAPSVDPRCRRSVGHRFLAVDASVGCARARMYASVGVPPVYQALKNLDKLFLWLLCGLNHAVVTTWSSFLKRKLESGAVLRIFRIHWLHFLACMFTS